MIDVLVIGAANIDIKAKANEPNLLGTSNPGVVSTTAGGVGRNIAHNLARLGAKVALISVVGEDAYGTAVLEETARAGVDVSRVARSSVATGSYVAMLDHDGELITALNDMRCADEISPNTVAEFSALMASAKLVLADCNLPQATLNMLAERVGEKLIVEPVSVTKSRKLVEMLKVAPLFLASPNFDQIDSLSGSRDIDQVFAFLHGKGLRNVVIHAGAEGAFVSDGSDIDHVEALPPALIVDVTGAGDAAVAGLVFGLLQGKSLVEAAQFGQQQAGRVIASAASTLE